MDIRQVLEENNKTIEKLLDLLVEFSGNTKEEVFSYSNVKPALEQIKFNKHYREYIVHLNVNDSEKLEYDTPTSHSNNPVDRQINADKALRKAVLEHPNIESYTVKGFVNAFNHEEISDLSYIQDVQLYIPYGVLSYLEQLREKVHNDYYQRCLKFVNDVYMHVNIENINDISRWEVISIFDKDKQLIDEKVLGSHKMEYLRYLYDEAKGSL